VSYSKALSLLTGAKTQQQFEAFEGCANKAEKARFYISESRARPLIRRSCRVQPGCVSGLSDAGIIRRQWRKACQPW